MWQPPKKSGQPVIRQPVELPARVYDRLDHIAKEKGLTRDEVIQRLLKWWLYDHPGMVDSILN